MVYGEYTVCTCRSLDLEFQDHPESILCLWEEVERCQKNSNDRDRRTAISHGHQAATRSKGFLKLLLTIGQAWGAATQEALVKAGFQPPEKEEVDPLLKALKDNKDLLPKAVRVALDNHNGQELTIQEEGDQSSKDLVSASHKCRILTKRKNHLAGQGHSG